MALYKGDEERKYIYRYRNVNKFTMAMLINNEFYISYPDEFNDPFDSIVHGIVQGTDSEIVAWLKTTPFPSKDHQMLLNNIKKGNFEYFDNNFKEFLLLCFSEDNNKTLLWSHYADSHKGICLSFNIKIKNKSLGMYFDPKDINSIIPGSAMDKGFLPLLKMEYDVTMPSPYNLVQGNDDEVQPFMITKSEDWQYENERRILLPKKAIKRDKYIRFQKETLEGICFGIKTSKIDIKLIDSIIQKEYIFQGTPVNYYAAEKNPGSYDLKIVKIDDFKQFLQDRK